MRKPALIGLSAALVGALLGAPVEAAGKKQSVSGSFVTPGKYTDGGCYAGLTRRLAIVSDGAVNGVSGYHFDIDPVTWNKPFVLAPTGGQGRLDLDIIFYSEFGTVEQAADPNFAPYNVPFETRSTTGEAGKVPPETTKAIVCLFIDEAQNPPTGVTPTFQYDAGKGVKIPKS